MTLQPCRYTGKRFKSLVFEYHLVFFHPFSGDQTGQIHFEGYQVSNVCMALVNDECLIPTRDAPELGYVKESSNEQYVPDVFYKVKYIWLVF